MIKKNRPIIFWLLSGCLLIFLMVNIGGITRLTGSGLSITEWNLIMGTFPPMNDIEWNIAFEKYQASPQFQKLNYHYSLEDFKSIFFWEYFHRLIGRLLGFVFIIPFIFFWVKKRIPEGYKSKLWILLALGAFQGFLGWFMVKSGLVDRPSVSHFRLALHLGTAFFTYGYSLWLALTLLYPVPANSPASRDARSFIKLLGIQIIYGAFVAGLKAGFIYNTWPLMGDKFFPEAIGTMDTILKDITENMATVQFIHRILAILILIFAFVIWRRNRNNPITSIKRSSKLVLLLVVFQFILGVFTILNFPVDPVFWGVIHQAGALLTLTGSVVFLYHSKEG